MGPNTGMVCVLAMRVLCKLRKYEKKNADMALQKL